LGLPHLSPCLCTPSARAVRAPPRPSGGLCRCFRARKNETSPSKLLIFSIFRFTLSLFCSSLPRVSLRHPPCVTISSTITPTCHHLTPTTRSFSPFLSLSLSLPAAGEAIPKDDYDGNGSHYGKYKYWPDCSDFETDIQTTCAELDRTTCPLKEAQSSLLCEWKAKGATDWMVKTTFFGTGACISLSLSLSLPFT
jgi:hypothetical protein